MCKTYYRLIYPWKKLWKGNGWSHQHDYFTVFRLEIESKLFAERTGYWEKIYLLGQIRRRRFELKFGDPHPPALGWTNFARCFFSHCAFPPLHPHLSLSVVWKLCWKDKRLTLDQTWTALGSHGHAFPSLISCLYPP